LFAAPFVDSFVLLGGGVVVSQLGGSLACKDSSRSPANFRVVRNLFYFSCLMVSRAISLSSKKAPAYPFKLIGRVKTAEITILWDF
jgi:hypothetical protein